MYGVPGGTYCPDTTQATGEYVKRQEDEYLKAPVGIIAHSVPKKLGTMVVGPRFELFVCDKDEIRRCCHQDPSMIRA